MSNIKLFLIILFLLCISYILYSIINSISNKKKSHENYNRILDGKVGSSSISKMIHTQPTTIIPPTPTSSSTLYSNEVTWVDKWCNMPDVKSKLSGFLVTKGNKLYISMFKITEDTNQQTPKLNYTSEIDENTMYIYTNEFVLPGKGQQKMQLVTYGIKNVCNSSRTELCNGMVSFVPSSLKDKVNTQFVKQITNTGKSYLVHKPTNLMITYFYITQPMIDAANMYPTGQIGGQKFATFYMTETPDMQFNVLANNKVGDLIMLTYIGNGLDNIFPFKTSAKLKNVNINQVFNIEINNEIDVNVEKGNIYIKKPILGIRGETIIQNKRLQYIPLNDKVGRIAVTPDASNDKSSSWEVVKPLGCDNCSKPNVCKNNKCQPCDEGSYYINGNCQVCNSGIVSSDKLSCFEGNLKTLGYVYENHPGNVQMADGTWLSLADVLTFISGPPDSVDSECFRYSDVKQVNSQYVMLGENVKPDVISNGWNYTKSLVKNWYDSFKNYVENAINSVKSWATNVSSETLKWVQGAGKSVLKDFVSIGGWISCNVKKELKAIANEFNKIAKFMVGIVEKADKAFKSAGDWIVGEARIVWDYINKPLTLYINAYFGGAPCEYYIKRKISKIDAIKAVEPVIVDPIRTQMTVLIKRAIEEILPEFYPFIEILMPFIEDIPGYNDKVNQLIAKLIELDFMVNSISSIVDNVVNPVIKTGCSIFDPDVSVKKIELKSPEKVVIDPKTESAFDDL